MYSCYPATLSIVVSDGFIELNIRIDNKKEEDFGGQRRRVSDTAIVM
jgi:hypothetical protein